MTDSALEKLAKALSHPTRRRIIAAMAGATQSTSAARLARELDEDLSNVSYHVKELKKFKLVKETGTRQVRGALEHLVKLDAKINLGVVNG